MEVVGVEVVAVPIVPVLEPPHPLAVPRVLVTVRIVSAGTPQGSTVTVAVLPLGLHDTKLAAGMLLQALIE